MEKILIPAPQFETVFLLNGAFSQNGAIKIKDKETLYLTVFPLSAMLVPYTVKIVGRKVSSNAKFCSIYSLDDEIDIAVLRPRNILVYTPQRQNNETRLPVKLFRTVKNKRIAAARLLMSKELNDSIDDDSLCSFFEEFSDIVPASLIDKSDKFILCRKDGSASYYDFVYKNGLIDDISESDRRSPF